MASIDTNGMPDVLRDLINQVEVETAAREAEQLAAKAAATAAAIERGNKRRAAALRCVLDRIRVEQGAEFGDPARVVDLFTVELDDAETAGQLQHPTATATLKGSLKRPDLVPIHVVTNASQESASFSLEFGWFVLPQVLRVEQTHRKEGQAQATRGTAPEAFYNVLAITSAQHHEGTKCSTFRQALVVARGYKIALEGEIQLQLQAGNRVV